MYKYFFILFLMIAFSLSHAQSVYKCVGENGKTTFSGQPCKALGEKQEVLNGYVNPSGLSDVKSDNSETDTQKLIVGRWKWTGGDEIRIFNDDGSFESVSKDDFAATKGRGKWKIRENKLIVTAEFENTFSDGSKVSANNVLRLTIKSIDKNLLVIYWNELRSTSKWSKL